MTTLSVLIDDAGGDTVPTAQLLRRSKIVASRLSLQSLGDWIECELNGYGSGDELPPYRGPFAARIVGTFTGPFQSRYDTDIPAMSLKPEYRSKDKALCFLRFHESIASLETTAAGTDDFLYHGWPADAVAMFERMIQPGVQLPDMHSLFSVKLPIPRTKYVEVVGTVRNRILDVMLGLERLNPAAADADGTGVDSGKADQIVNTYIYGGTNNLSVADSSTVSQSSNAVVAGDRPGLIAALAGIGLPKSEVASLEQAFAQDDSEDSAGDDAASRQRGPGRNVAAWLGALPYRIGALTVTTGSGTVAGVATDLIAKHYGIT
ncbi:MAG: hypothetical protein JWN95_479 [Frankiales bacterium]|nr:hypothetical protein [Frankiales bacterium]